VAKQWTFYWMRLKRWSTLLIKIGRFDELCKWWTQPTANFEKLTWKNDRAYIWQAIWIVAF
jgi:hypothetical protein